MEGSGSDFKSPAHGLHHLPLILYGFRAGRGTGTATLEAKLLKQLVTLIEEVLYVIFLDLHKAYEALDRSMCLRYPGGIRRGTPIQEVPPDIREVTHDGGESVGLLLDSIPGSARGDTGRTALPPPSLMWWWMQ